MKDELIIVNHIGTSVEAVITEELGKLVEDIKTSTEADVVLAFSSQRAIDKLKKKAIKIDHIHDCILGAAGNYKVIKVLPTHLVGGGDYQRVKSFCEKAANELRVGVEHSEILLIKSLLTEGKNIRELVNIIVNIIKETDAHVLFVGHGTAHRSEKYYKDFILKFEELRSNVSFVTLETNLEEIIKDLPKKLVLFPLFTVNGHHIQKDIFDGEGSIYKQLVASGIDVHPYNRGLLSYKEVRRLYLKSLN